ncbi:hypothetical protein bas48_0130 [Escherichia phage CarlMeissner]|uniref:Uncharacterized protein n=1 Tax=Escherichia phage AlexBoehm TaxID=2852028 RepID=A0AAE7VNS8_9CAUD|nr:hypothetical protein bas56_0126 [Escherichia phage AlexBoehm]QXV76696.1 hypothetical protein bas48_0130 [Escherichia phage CarlMeissner]QXV82869.1 hypothetical protein bas57_0128 [Escherichia phage MaxTheCat]
MLFLLNGRHLGTGGDNHQACLSYKNYKNR